MYAIYIDAASVRLTREYNRNVDLAYMSGSFAQSDPKKVKLEKHYAKDPLRQKRITIQDRRNAWIAAIANMAASVPVISQEEHRRRMECNEDPAE